MKIKNNVEFGYFQTMQRCWFLGIIIKIYQPPKSKMYLPAMVQYKSSYIFKFQNVSPPRSQAGIRGKRSVNSTRFFTYKEGALTMPLAAEMKMHWPETSWAMHKNEQRKEMQTFYLKFNLKPCLFPIPHPQ